MNDGGEIARPSLAPRPRPIAREAVHPCKTFGETISGENDNGTNERNDPRAPDRRARPDRILAKRTDLGNRNEINGSVLSGRGLGLGVSCWRNKPNANFAPGMAGSRRRDLPAQKVARLLAKRIQ